MIPASFARDGFLDPETVRRGGRKFRRMMLALEGPADSGKTELAMSGPGPGLGVLLDRGFDSIFDNMTPPPTRRHDFAFKVVAVSAPTQEQQSVYELQWKEIRGATYAAINNPEVRTVLLDGDGDSWEIQRLAEHGKTHGVYPQTKFSDVYAARRGFYYRLFDSGKFIIATNKVMDEYAPVLDKDGNQVLDEKGEPKKQKTGQQIARGFPDQDYLWMIRCRTMTRQGKKGVEWGMRITKCKSNGDVVGQELWGPECNIETLLMLVYPNVDLAEWGY